MENSRRLHGLSACLIPRHTTAFPSIGPHDGLLASPPDFPRFWQRASPGLPLRCKWCGEGGGEGTSVLPRIPIPLRRLAVAEAHCLVPPLLGAGPRHWKGQHPGAPLASPCLAHAIEGRGHGSRRALRWPLARRVSDRFAGCGVIMPESLRTILLSRLGDRHPAVQIKILARRPMASLRLDCAQGCSVYLP